MHTKLGIVYTSNDLFGDRTWQNNVTNLLPLIVSVEEKGDKQNELYLKKILVLEIVRVII